MFSHELTFANQGFVGYLIWIVFNLKILGRFKSFLLLLTPSLKARPVENYRGRKDTLSLESVVWDSFEFFSFFVLSGWLIKCLSSILRTEHSLDSFSRQCALIHHNPHHLLTTTTDQTKFRKHPSSPTSLPAWPFSSTHLQEKLVFKMVYALKMQSKIFK